MTARDGCPDFERLDAEPPAPVERRRVDFSTVTQSDGGFWVFGYGSLMWNPGFEVAERRHAVLFGYARRFCLWSVRYRGTPATPGLVLALAPEAGAETRGVAFRVDARHADTVMAYLGERELVTAAYNEVAAPVRFTCKPKAPMRAATAVAYVIDPGHHQYAGGLTLEDQAQIIAESVGPKGPNAEYLLNTVAHLNAIGVDDPELEQLASRVRDLLGQPLGKPDLSPPDLADPMGD